MSPDLLPGIAVLARVARHGSFTRAADELGTSVSALSQAVRSLERRLGVRLLERTTRRVGPTEAGRQFLEAAGAGLDSIAAAVEALEAVRHEPTGIVRLNLSRVAASLRVLPVLAAFEARYPGITLELHCDNRLVDLVGGGFDAGIRLGESLARDVVAVPLGGALRLAVFAAPTYLARHGVPSAPAELAGQRCLNMRLASGGLYRWEFARGRRVFDVAVEGPVISNDAAVVQAAALSGLGIAFAFEEEVAEDFARGSLVPVLESWWPTFPGFHLYYASRSELPRRLRVLIDFLREAWPVPPKTRAAAPAGAGAGRRSPHRSGSPR